MDGKKGIILDNFSLRGSSGLSLRGIPQQMLRQFNEQRPYDLIILEYGLNVATERGRNYDNYQKGLLTSIEHLKNCFPQASILLLSVGDRDYKTEDGELRTMPGVKNLIRYQQNIAAESGIAFGICSKRWAARAVWRIWYMPNLRWRTMIIRISTFAEASIWPDCFMKH